MPADFRRARLALVGFIALVGLSLIWPLYTLVAGASPFVLGLPLPLAWLVACLAAVFLALLLLYRLDHGSRSEATGEDHGR